MNVRLVDSSFHRPGPVQSWFLRGRWKRGTGKRGTKLQGWKMQDKFVWNAKWLRMESSV